MDLARNWRLKNARYHLEGSQCETCGETHFPARKVCRTCRSRQQTATQLQGRGEVYSYTTLHQAPTGFPTPYVVALVQLREGPLVTAQLTDVKPEAIYVGMPVEMVTRKLSEQGENGLLVYGYKFRPPVSVYEQGEKNPAQTYGYTNKEVFVPMQPMHRPMALPVAGSAMSATSRCQPSN